MIGGGPSCDLERVLRYTHIPYYNGCMTAFLDKLIRSLEHELTTAHDARIADGAPPLAVLHIKILGQMALRIHPDTPPALHVIQTADLDALLEGDWTGKSILKRCLAEHALVYDELSKEVWIPPGATFTELHRSSRLIIEVIDPKWGLVSKAVKAPSKNKFLIQDAIAFYGEEFISQILNAGGDPSVFVEES